MKCGPSSLSIITMNNINIRQPFFSVIIPVYNAVKLVGETLESVFAQECEDFEIIVVNDGSTDNTRDVLEAYAENCRLRMRIIQQENKGEGGARNRGIFSAQGKYLAFLDQDDLWFPWTLETYFNVLQTHDFPSILVASGAEFHNLEDAAKIKYAEISVSVYEDFFSAAHDQYLPAGTPGTVVKAEEAQRIGGLSEDRVIGIDQEIFLKLGEAKGLVHVTSPVTVAIRRHEGNLQRNVTMAAKGALLFIDRECRNMYPGKSDRKWTRRRIISRWTRTVSMQCLRAKYYRQAWEIYFRTFFWNLYLWRIKYLLGFPLKHMFERILKLQ